MKAFPKSKNKYLWVQIWRKLPNYPLNCAQLMKNVRVPRIELHGRSFAHCLIPELTHSTSRGCQSWGQASGSNICTSWALCERVSFNHRCEKRSDFDVVPDSKIRGANMGPTWVLLAPNGPHVGPMNLTIRDGNRNVSCNIFHGTCTWVSCALFWFTYLAYMKTLVDSSDDSTITANILVSVSV